MGDSSFNLDLLKERVFSPVDLFWVKKNGKKVLLVGRGDFLDHTRLEKYFSFSLVTEGSLDHLNEIKSLFENLKEVESDRERYVIAGDITKEFCAHLNEYSEEDLIILGEELFFDLPQDDISLFSKMKSDYMERASLCGMLSVLMALGFGYYGFNFLKDLYHSHFAVTKIHGLSTLEIDQLENYRTSDDLSLDKNIFEKTTTALSYRFESKAVKKIAYFMLERRDGRGPNKLNENELSDLEMIVSEVQRTVSFVKPFWKESKVDCSFSRVEFRMKDCG